MGYVFALSSKATGVFHVANEGGKPACGARIHDHHRDVSWKEEPVGYNRCKRKACSKEGE